MIVLHVLYWTFVWSVALTPFLAPPALVAVLAVPRWRRRVFRPLYRRAESRRVRARAARQAVIEAETGRLEAELAAVEAELGGGQ